MLREGEKQGDMGANCKTGQEKILRNKNLVDDRPRWYRDQCGIIKIQPFALLHYVLFFPLSAIPLRGLVGPLPSGAQNNIPQKKMLLHSTRQCHTILYSTTNCDILAHNMILPHSCIRHKRGVHYTVCIGAPRRMIDGLPTGSASYTLHDPIFYLTAFLFHSHLSYP